MKENWLHILAHMTYGIYVLTAAHGEKTNGMVASWAVQASYEPPLILAAVHRDRYSNQLIRKSGAFALHLLTRGQASLLARFKGPDPEAKFASMDWEKGKTGSPVLKECLGYLECVVTQIFDPGNHTLFVGRIVAGELVDEGEPLTTLDYAGVYTGKA